MTIGNRLISNTVATIDAEAGPSPRRHAFAKAKRWSALLAKFVSVQIIVQAIGLVTGIFLVRMLSQRQYAYFTIANTMQGTIAVLADSGISIGLSAIGGKVWHDRYRFGQLITTALQLRKILTTGAVLIVTPILIWMLIKNGASTVYAVLVAAAVLVGVSAQLTTGVLEVVPRLHSQVSRLQKLDLFSAMSRLLLLGGAYLVSFNAAFTVLAASASLVLKNRILSRWVTGDVETDAPPLEADRTDIISIVKQQLPNSIFYCIQGQITIWLIGIFGNARSIAELGALGRLGLILSIVSSVMVNLVAPSFAKCHNRIILLRRYWQILVAYTTLSALILSVSTLFPTQVLWILGRQYAHLKSELFLIMLNSMISGFLGVIWSLNVAKGWIKYIWLYIPLTIVAQAVLLFILNVGTVRGAVMFGLLSILPNILLNFFLSYTGFKQITVPVATFSLSKE